MRSERRRFRKVLITGIAGSGGSYLAEHILATQPGVEVHGLARWHSTTQDNLGSVASRVSVHEADLCDFGSVFQILRRIAPDAVFHVAAHANVRASFATPAAVLTNNILGTSNLLESIRLGGLDPVFQMCSTSEVYGQVGPGDVPIREECPFRPVSPYAVSKATQDLLGRAYFASWGTRVVTTRMFSYLNPRRTDLFATAFARQVARMELGLQDELRHGNLDSVRTLLDVRDAMAAYWEALELGEPGEVYNIGGETTMKVGDFLEVLIGLARVPIPHCEDPSLLRPADVTLQVPCVDRFRAATGWVPKIPFEESVAFLLEHWRRATLLETRDLLPS